MREIKFRAWHKEHKLMFEVFGFDVNTIYPWQRECDPEIPIAPDTEDCTLMQYTGLKDKNGKEIYEGDIVIAYNEDCDTICKGEIVWDKWECGFSIKGAEPTFIGWYPSLEVIGNIYENPELLD